MTRNRGRERKQRDWENQMQEEKDTKRRQEGLTQRPKGRERERGRMAKTLSVSV